MVGRTWFPKGGESVVLYESAHRKAYEAGLPSKYDRWGWPSELLVGRNNRADRCFPEVAVRSHFEEQGFRVLISAPKYPDGLGFLLFHYSGLRRRNPPHPAFARMVEQFPEVDLNRLAEIGRAAKLRQCRAKGGSGGDPDLFVFRHGSKERFFVEVKDKDALRCSQLVCFPIIEEHLGCEVKVVRIAAINENGDA